jgi:hypothetical protein
LAYPPEAVIDGLTTEHVRGLVVLLCAALDAIGDARAMGTKPTLRAPAGAVRSQVATGGCRRRACARAQLRQTDSAPALPRYPAGPSAPSCQRHRGTPCPSPGSGLANIVTSLQQGQNLSKSGRARRSGRKVSKTTHPARDRSSVDYFARLRPDMSPANTGWPSSQLTGEYCRPPRDHLAIGRTLLADLPRALPAAELRTLAEQRR